MKITFLNPPFHKKFSRPQRSPAVTKSGTLYYPMWLAHAAALCDSVGHEIDFIDAPADELNLVNVIQRVTAFAPELLVVETSTPSIYNDVHVCNKLKEALPSIFITLVGTHVSALPKESLELSESIDAVTIGEYDYTIKELADKVDIKTINGLCYRLGKDIFFTEKRQLIADIDSLPFVSTIYKKFLKMENYFNPNALHPMVTITASRGCPQQCIFCIYPQTMMGHKFRLRSVEKVVKEITYIVENFPGVKSIFFEDDTFTVTRKRCIEISDGIMQSGIKISWTANSRVDLDYETMKIMKRAGCRCLCVGFESGSQILLDNIKKHITTEKTAKFMENAKKAGILIHGCFIVGLPGETKQTMEETLSFAKKLNSDTVQFYPIMVYPGTEAYNWYKERGLISTNDFSKWLTPAGLHNSVVRSENLTAKELVSFCDHARRSFYLRPTYILYKLKQSLLDADELRRNVKSAKTLFKHLIRGSDI
ncbi:MAG: B12-binding domain-containing radical SAM protein [Candidatus Magnetoovum sp. WYHC-5]|nr:B12-binding domain-containing radical SAM protein [Candidatus Magnetoovum sp. WYHC-5]